MATFRSQRTDSSTLGESALSKEQYDGTNAGTMRRRGGVLAVVVPRIKMAVRGLSFQLFEKGRGRDADEPDN